MSEDPVSMLDEPNPLDIDAPTAPDSASPPVLDSAGVDTTPLDAEEVDELLNSSKWLGAIKQDQIRAQGRDYFAEIELPMGFHLRDGQHIRSLVIREMSGRDDTLLMDADNSPQESMSRLAVSCIVSLGDITESKDIGSLVRGPMLVGDFSYLLFKVRQLSVGNKIQFSGECDRCMEVDTYSTLVTQMEFDAPPAGGPEQRHISTEFSKFGPVGWTFNWHWMTQGDSAYLNRMIDYLIGLDTKKRTKRRRRSTLGSTKKSQRSLSDLIRLGVDPVTAAIIARLDSVVEPPETNAETEEVTRKTVKLGRSAKPVAGTLTIEESVQYVKGLPTAMRIFLWGLINDSEPGVNAEVDYECAHCGAENSTTIHPQDPSFFFPTEIDLD